MIKGVIFDLDGTLADTIPICLIACREAIASVSDRALTDQEIKALFGPTEEGVIRRLVPKERWNECLNTYLRAYERAHAACTSPFDGIDDALQLLKRRRIPMAIVTGKGEPSAAISLRFLGFGHYYDRIETGSPDGDIKASNIRKVLAAWNLPPEAAVYVGDAPADIRAAREAGVLPVVAAWAQSANRERLLALSPEVFLESTADFVRWLEANVNGR
ncbi:MAG: HAD family hydrolase [Candidatus Sumerlaeia bacterium]|nr:HAD family hydrolase [Candidatus Sumerlaeia bacterium]